MLVLLVWKQLNILVWDATNTTVCGARYSIIIEMTGLHDSLRYVVHIFVNAALYFSPNEHVLNRLSSLVGYNWRMFEYAFQ